MRQFLAIEPGDDLLVALSGLVGRLRAAAPGWRWVRPDALHLTLRFLGDVDPAIDAAGRQAWRATAAARHPCRLCARGLDVFPNARRPRVLVVPVEESDAARPLAAFAGALERAARGLGFDAEERSFRPHFTLARAAHGGRAALPSDRGLEPFEFRAERLSLVRSDLLPAGARYTVLETFELGGAPSVASHGERG